MRLLVFNPGSNSLKFHIVDTAHEQRTASGGTSRLTAAIENFGKPATLSEIREGKTVEEHQVDVHDMTQATRCAIDWMRDRDRPLLQDVEAVGVRVVHGGTHFDGAALFDAGVRAQIESMEQLAPLHNKNSLAIIDVVAGVLPQLPVAVTFDTAFHRTLPEVAWRYPIDRSTADRHGLRKFGFHGVSHRYMVERYAELAGKPVGQVTLITLHLESGSSACAVRHGRSVDTTMGLTPLEGLMMGTRSGSVDPALVEVLMRKEGIDVAAAMDILNKRSGLLGIGGNLDTRVLVKQDDDAAHLALTMFSYRVRLAVGAYLAALGDAEAIVFGAGIGEDSPAIRAAVCEGFSFAGARLDPAANEQALSGEARISAPDSKLALWAMPSQEGLQIAHECAHMLRHR